MIFVLLISSFSSILPRLFEFFHSAVFDNIKQVDSETNTEKIGMIIIGEMKNGAFVESYVRQRPEGTWCFKWGKDK